MSSLLIIIKLLLCTIVCLAICKDVKSTLTCLTSLNKEMSRLQSTLMKQPMVKKEAVFETRFETRCTRDSCSTHTVTSQNVSIPSVSTPNTCHQGWKSRGRSCYNLFKDHKTNWFQAQMNCRKYGGNLVQIQDVQENTWLKKHFSGSDVWTDAVDLGKEGQWTFFSSGRPLKYFKWKRREPNNAKPGEDCTIIDLAHYGRWDDRNCQWKYHSLCEIDLK
uniref:C-type lectin mannose-binding isoform-like isoform X2 n=1 Tax=Crassostrea virginica TaxID=6565 RepID=A0A8B8BHY7_CRAVI|nr:C-type lectin mannose-binding isoform-like isoform X2 [Crassostrea virginica]